MKVLLFVQNGLTKPEHLLTQFEYSSKGHHLILTNGSAIGGFEDSCDKILMDCENYRITEWAVSKGISIEKYVPNGSPVSVAPSPREEYVHNKPVDNIDEITIDNIIESQVAKATAEAEPSKDTVVHDIPYLSKVPVGLYTDPDGNQYERKKGPKLKGDLKAAIQKFGFDQLKYNKGE